ncbi:MAG TPA: hypothetical protein VFB92_09335 [Vicinamibacterales bacterium]|nr:hypothetical protein [Vicinamibacterales bacterium]
MVRHWTPVIVLVAIASASFAAAPETTAQTGAPAPVCVAIVLPSVQGVEGDATQVASAVRELLRSFLTGPSMQSVLIEARLPSQSIEEARQKNCGRVLTAALTRKRGSGGGLLGRVVGQAGTTAAWSLPGGGVGGALARGAAVAATQTASEVASSTKAKDEMRIEYRLSPVSGGTTLGPKTERAKAKVDGEDLLTPLVQKVAEAVAAAL